MYPGHWEFKDEEKSGYKIDTSIVDSAICLPLFVRIVACAWVGVKIGVTGQVTDLILSLEYKVNGNIYYVLWGEAALELEAMLYTSIVTLYLVCFLHCFEPVQCRSTIHPNEYDNRSSLTRRCLRSCFLVRDFSFDLHVLTNSDICTWVELTY